MEGLIDYSKGDGCLVQYSKRDGRFCRCLGGVWRLAASRRDLRYSVARQVQQQRMLPSRPAPGQNLLNLCFLFIFRSTFVFIIIFVYTYIYTYYNIFKTTQKFKTSCKIFSVF